MLAFGAETKSQSEDVPSRLWQSSSRFISVLMSDGDSRLAIDPRTRLNKYLCPAAPRPGLICASSCTASPIEPGSFDRASSVYEALTGAGSALERAQVRAEQHHAVKAGLLRYFEAESLAEAILCPSGTNALLTATMLIASERPGLPMTVIIPSASETGTGVPLAAACRSFDGPGCGVPRVDCAVNTVEIPLRSSEGEPWSDDEIDAAFASATAAAHGRPVIYLTHGTKTGLIAPASPPPDVEVIVDACQVRMAPAEVVAYLRRGWPVVVTGSKFFGGPAFSGAVLFPRERLSVLRRHLHSASPGYAGIASALDCRPDVGLGRLLRWTAALHAMEAFKPLAGGMADLLRRRAAIVHRSIGYNPALVPVPGLQPRGPGWSGTPSIFTFGVRDPANYRRRLSAGELRPLYESLARRGILLGQPVNLGPFGGLRIAVGARDLVKSASDGGLPHLFDALEEATRPASFGFEQRGFSAWR